ncbi:DUF5696 domain-containing protein [Paenibacillus tarimensis]
MKNRKLIISLTACAALFGIIAAAFYFLLLDRTEDVALMPHRSGLEEGAEARLRPAGNPPMEDMLLAAENETLEMYYHEATAEVAIRDKRNNHVWWTNPKDREEDMIASPYEKAVLSSQFTLTFRDRFTNLMTFVSYTDSVERNQAVTESIENGIRVTYTVGESTSAIDALPKLISKQRLEEAVLSKLSPEDAKYVSARYYPLNSNPDVLERLDDVVSRELVLKKMLAAFEQAGYDEEQLQLDNEANGISEGVAVDKPSFVIPLEYRLDGDSVVVTIPAGHIEEADTYQISSIDLLTYFGAAGTESSGYSLVPDGTGSLIHHNNGKVRDEHYSQVLYGPNQTYGSSRRTQITEHARLPVFGMKSGDAAWMGVIEEGDAIASIRADISGKRNSYNYAYTSFNIRDEDEVTLATANKVEDIPVLTKNKYEGNITVRYSFLYNDQADYSGMAATYRGMLQAESKLIRLEEKDSIPFYLDMVGAVTKRKFILGVPYESNTAMTTFSQAEAIYGQLQNSGISNVQMRYLGWFNDGIYHKIPTNVKTTGALGGASGIRKLSDMLLQGGGQLYPDVAFQNVYQNTPGFSPTRDAARYVTREVAWRAHYNRARNRMNLLLGDYYVLSPVRLPSYVERFAGGYDGLGLDGLSLRDLGDLLNSDDRPGRVVLRENAKFIVKDQLEKLSVQSPDLMISGGNAYALPYAKHLIDVPMASSRFNITDEEVPFYQMVVHGSIDYAGFAYNLDDRQNSREALLKMIEYGASPRFTWSHAASSELKSTMFDYLFSANYREWIDQAVSMYEELNEALAGVRTEPIVGHTKLREGVYETVYGNGISIIVNYLDEPVTVNGRTVQAKNYAVGGEKR